MRQLWPLLVLAGVLSSCKCGTPQAKKTSGIIVIVLPDGSQKTEQDTALDFDQACLANPDVPVVTRTLTLKNVGPNPLTIQSLTITGASKASFKITTSPPPDTIDAQGETPLELSFAPTSQGNQSATLAITTDDPVKAIVNVQLLGTGSSLGPTATFSSLCELADGGASEDTTCTYLDFPSVTVGQTGSRAIHLTNGGCPPLHITDVTVVNDSTGADGGVAFAFHGTAPSEAAPLDVAAGETADLLLDFTPPGNDSFSGTVIVTTSGSPSSAEQSHGYLADGSPVASNQFATLLLGNGTQALVVLAPAYCDYNDTTAASLCHPTPVSGSDDLDGTFTLHNAGGEALTVSALEISGDAGATFTVNPPSPLPFDVAANATVPFTVTYHPLNGYANAQLVLTSTGGSASAQLQGGNPPHITSAPLAVSFGDESLGTYVGTQPLDLQNQGVGLLTVNGFAFLNTSGDGDGGCPEFSAMPSPAFPFDLAANGGSQTVSLAHHPDPSGGFNACQLEIFSNDPAYPDATPYTVSLQAKTYTNCKPIALESPNGTTAVTLATSPALTLSGAPSYDPGMGADGHESACAGGLSQAIRQWDWTLSIDPTYSQSTTHLVPLPGATTVVCKRGSLPDTCTELVVSNTNLSDLQNPTAEDSSVSVVFDPVFKAVNLYKVELGVTDGTSPDGFVSSAPDSLNITTQ